MIFGGESILVTVDTIMCYLMVSLSGFKARQDSYNDENGIQVDALKNTLKKQANY